MVLTEEGHKRLLTLMLIRGKNGRKMSRRQLAEIAGWQAHSYADRLVRGKVNTLKPEAAVRIANYFGVPIEDLFLSRVSTDTARPVARHTAKRSA